MFRARGNGTIFPDTGREIHRLHRAGRSVCFLRKDGWLLWTDTDGERTQEVQLSLPEGSRAYALVLTDKDLFVFGEDRDGLWAMTTDGDVRFTLPDTKLIQATTDKSGAFFILTDGALLQVGEDGSVLQTIDNTVLESVLWYQNMLFGLTRDEVHDCYALSVIDFERKETSQTVLTGVPLPSGTTYAQLAQGADGSFYLATVYALYRIDYNAQTIEKVFHGRRKMCRSRMRWQLSATERLLCVRKRRSYLQSEMTCRHRV